MNILLVHTYYQQPGGEDLSFEAEAELLEHKGHVVRRFTAHNDALNGMPWWQQAQVTLWNQKAYRELYEAALAFDAEIVHFNNTFPLLSPAVYHAAHRAGAAVVQTLRNYRLFCANGLFFRDGHPCEDCVGHTPPWPGVKHACYRGSHVASAGVASMLTLHRLLQTWEKQVDYYIALTRFAYDTFRACGIPQNKLAIKPNFLPYYPAPENTPREAAIFVGRLSPEKGVDILLEAWQNLDVPLKLLGSGPEEQSIRALTRARPDIEVLGHQQREDVFQHLRTAKMLLFPSRWYETFGRTIIEAFATGTPVVASDLGAMQSLVDHGRTGLLFRPGDATDLAEKVRWLGDHPAERETMGRAARAEYEEKYTAERNYELLMQIYEDALRQRQITSS